MADRSGIEPDSHGLTVRPHTFVRFGQYLVAGPGVEPGTKAYETFMIPFQYPAALLIFGSGGENRTPPYMNCPDGHEVDHIHPISKGGLHSPNNLQYLPINENRKKWAHVMAPRDGDDPPSSVLETDVLPT